MKRNKLFALVAVVALVAAVLCGCGEEAKPTEAAEEVLGLTHWDLTAATWSSPNGATVNLSAVPASYAEGQTAAFVVRLEGEDVKNVPCEYDGTNYTASVDLNGADGYCYYVTMTGSDGSTAEIPVNVPTDPIDESLINMASALESYCSLAVFAFDFDGKWLSITDGTIQVQPPRIVNAGEAITCTTTEVVLSHNDNEIQRVAVQMPEEAQDGAYTLALTDLAFEVPALEDGDQQLAVRLEVKLSNGQTLSAVGGAWMYNDGQLIMGMG